MRAVQSVFLAWLPTILFILGFIWVLLFPAVSISSGELKPRGIYVDEHSLLVQSNIVGTPKMVNPHHYEQQSQVCESFDPETSYCSFDEKAEISQIELLPRHSTNFFDTTMLVFQFNSREDCSYHISVALAHSIVMELNNARWNARKVLILLVPAEVSNSTQYEVLQSWLKQHHTPTTEDIIQAEIAELSSLLNGSSRSSRSVGTIREVYIFDLSDPTICNTELASTGTPAAVSTAVSAISSNNKGEVNDPLSFDAAILHYTGPHGTLPNMDLIAYPLAKFPKVLMTESQQCAITLHKTIDSLYAHYLQLDVNSLVTILLKPIITVLYTMDAALPPAYRQRLLGLFCSMHALITTEHSVHGYFAHYNIDAITIKPTKTKSDKKIGVPSKIVKKTSKKNANFVKKVAKNTQLGSDTLLHMALSFLYISNNLQGKEKIQLFVNTS